jgi:hypothetical protein
MYIEAEPGPPSGLDRVDITTHLQPIVRDGVEAGVEGGWSLR